MDPAGAEIIAAEKNINLQKLSFGDDVNANWVILEQAHGIQFLASTEMQPPYMPERPMIERCKNLLAFSVIGAGYDMFDVDACTKTGVLVVNQTGANSESVAQHVFGLMLVLSKQIIQGDRRMRRQGDDWDRWEYQGKELTGRTLGIIGLGNVGRRVSALAGQMFGMRVIAHDPYLTNDDFRERGAEAVSLDDVFKAADFISVNCPLSEETTGMVGAKEFALMKPTAYFVTTARGGIHDEAALAAVLADGKIAGAGLDVFTTEPPPYDHPLMDFENVIVSPHVAGITDDCLYNMATYAAKQWLTIFRGQRPPRLINPNAWPIYRDRFEKIIGTPVKD